MAKRTRFNLATLTNKIILVFLFLLFAFGSYYLFKMHFAFREGKKIKKQVNRDNVLDVYRLLTTSRSMIEKAFEGVTSLDDIKLNKNLIEGIQADKQTKILDKLKSDKFNFDTIVQKIITDASTDLKKKKTTDFEIIEKGIKKIDIKSLPKFQKMINTINNATNLKQVVEIYINLDKFLSPHETASGSFNFYRITTPTEEATETFFRDMENFMKKINS